MCSESSKHLTAATTYHSSTCPWTSLSSMAISRLKTRLKLTLICTTWTTGYALRKKSQNSRGFKTNSVTISSTTSTCPFRTTTHFLLMTQEFLMQKRRQLMIFNVFATIAIYKKDKSQKRQKKLESVSVLQQFLLMLFLELTL